MLQQHSRSLAEDFANSQPVPQPGVYVPCVHRINLRIFAEVQVLAWLLLLGLLLWATRGVFLGGGAGAGTGAGAGGGSRAPPVSYGAAAGTGTAARYGGGPYDYQQQHVRQAYVQRQQQQQQAGAGAPADGGYRF